MRPQPPAHPLLKLDRRYFKLIGGANFTDYPALRYLAALYALAGADLVDVAATPHAVAATMAGLADARLIDPQTELPTVMVSVTAGDDPHCRLAVQDPERCSGTCPPCRESCPHQAINEALEILDDRCVGCGLCVAACPYEAIAMRHLPLAPALDELWTLGARGLELHAGSGDLAELDLWRDSCTAWVRRGGLFSLSVSGEQMSLETALDRIQRVCGWFEGARIIVQTDGKPISGRAGLISTLPAIDWAEQLLVAGVDAAIQPAGGANDRTGQLADERGVAIAGVGMGSYARAIIRGIADGPAAPAGTPDPGVGEDLARARALVRSIQPLGGRA